MIRNKGIAVMCTAAAIAYMFPVTSLAKGVYWSGTPRFAYTEEEWNKLEDDIVEYDELSDLIHIYNITIQNNRISYADFVNSGNLTNEEIRNNYMNSAKDLFAVADDVLAGVDETSESYASLVAASQNSRAQAKQLLQQADSDTSNNETVKLGYEMTEVTLLSSTQEIFNSYHQMSENLKTLQSQKQYQEAVYNGTVVQAQAGAGTQMDVLTAKETLQNVEASIAKMESSVKSLRQSLCVVLGREYNDNISIGALPEVDFEKISAIDLEADKQKALENNYTLRQNNIKLTNTHDSTSRKILQDTIAEQEKKIRLNVATSYQSLTQAKADYEQAKAQLELEKKNMEAAEVKNQAGTISMLDYTKQSYDTTSKQAECNTLYMALYQAYEKYEWAVNGLAATE